MMTPVCPTPFSLPPAGLNGCGRNLPVPTRSDAPAMVTPGVRFVAPPDRFISCDRNCPGPSWPDAPAMVLPETRILPPDRCGAPVPLAIEPSFHSRQPVPVSLSTPDGEEPRVVVDKKTNTVPPSEQISSDLLIHEWEQTLRSGFEPLRQRSLPGVLATAATGAQRAGSALPSFLPRWLSTDQSLEVAQLIGPFRRTLELAFSVGNRNTVEKIASSPKDAKASRRKAIRQLTALAGVLQPARQRLAATLPMKSPARNLHIPLIAFLVNKLGYDDKLLPVDLVKGMNITGEIPTSRVLAKRITPALKRLKTLRAGLRTRNKGIINSISKVKDPILRGKCWELSREEHLDGRLSKPTPVTLNDRNEMVLSPRFCISEQHGGKHSKFRVVDDLSRSLVNSTSDTSDTYCP